MRSPIRPPEPNDLAPEFVRMLTLGEAPACVFPPKDIRCETVMVAMRDGVRLATDIYLPPVLPAPVVAVRTPYGRATDNSASLFMSLARRGYVCVSQDCRGTGDSEPDAWDYYLFEAEDGVDLVEWITAQPWYGGFIGSVGGSYLGQTQWCMAAHPAMSATIPIVSGLGFAKNTAHLYLFLDAYARTVGKGEGKIQVPYYEIERSILHETLAGGYFNEPLSPPLPDRVLQQFPELSGLAPSEARQELWKRFCGLTCAERAAFAKAVLGVAEITSVTADHLLELLGQTTLHDVLTIPSDDPAALCRSINAPPLMLTGWYDWCLNDAFETWNRMRADASAAVASQMRMVIGPHAHAMAGYHEGMERDPALARLLTPTNCLGLLLAWYAAVREGTADSWPRIIYYLMGANSWKAASDWPPPEAKEIAFYLGDGGALTLEPPSKEEAPDVYDYDPDDPTPTLGGSLVSWVYPPGSVDVSSVQERRDVLAFTTPPLETPLDVVGPLRVVLYASSSSIDTDFAVRLSDVFPDGRAIQIQSNMLRARHRENDGEPKPLEPGRIYRLEIDLWATANRFEAGHRLRLDISSADFPRFDRNTNRGGEPGAPVVARQTIHHDPAHPSRLMAFALRS